MEKRRHKRLQLIYYLRVFDRKSGQLMGHMVDITAEGIMLLSDQPIKNKTVFELAMVLPPSVGEKKRIAFDAMSVWSRRDVNPDFYDTGLKFINITPEDAMVIRQLTDDFLLPG